MARIPTAAAKAATAKASRRRETVDQLIDRIYRRRCSGIAINVLDIGKVYAAGHSAFYAGGTVTEIEAAVVAKLEELKVRV
jgi:hypothetical protein